MSSTRTIRRILVFLTAAVVAVLGLSPQAGAGGGPPHPDILHFEAVFINCVDDEIDEPGVDGDALVRVRFTHDYAGSIEVVDGGWELNQDGTALASGSYVTPVMVESGATWEQVVVIPGGTGAAWFRSAIEVRYPGGMSTTTLVLDPALGVPGDCEQPGQEPAAEPAPTDPAPTTTSGAAPDLVRAVPRFTG